MGEVALKVLEADAGQEETKVGPWQVAYSWHYVAEPCTDEGPDAGSVYGRLILHLNELKRKHAKPHRHNKQLAIPGQEAPPETESHDGPFKLSARVIMSPGMLKFDIPAFVEQFYPPGGSTTFSFQLFSFVRAPICRFELRNNQADGQRLFCVTTLRLPEPAAPGTDEARLPNVANLRIARQDQLKSDNDGQLSVKYSWAQVELED